MTPAVLVTSNTLGLGGAERQRVQLANGLTTRGYQVTLVLLQDGGPLLAEVDPHVTVLRSPWHHPRPEVRGDAVAITGTTQTEAAFGALWRTTGAFLPGRRRRWVFAEHRPPEPDGPTYRSRLAALIRTSDGVVALSPTHWAQITAHQRLHRKPAWLVPNGAPSLPRQGPRCRPRTQSVPIRLVFLGRLVEHKNVQTLVSALTPLADLPWTLDVYGDGPYRDSLEAQLSSTVRNRIRFHGWVPRPADVLENADLLVLPSRREAFPMVLLEAMASGVAVMASAVAAVPEMLANNSGIVVPDCSVAAWRRALSDVLANPGVLEGIAARGRERALRDYTQERMLDGYERVLADVLNVRRRPEDAPDPHATSSPQDRAT